MGHNLQTGTCANSCLRRICKQAHLLTAVGSGDRCAQRGLVLPRVRAAAAEQCDELRGGTQRGSVGAGAYAAGSVLSARKEPLTKHPPFAPPPHTSGTRARVQRHIQCAHAAFTHDSGCALHLSSTSF
eukprot:1158574-Pelagomonas_calceolata.AAC.5